MEASEVGKEVGHYQNILETNRWLNTLLALVRGESSVEGKQVRVVSLILVHGIATWLKQNDDAALESGSLSTALKIFMEELEQWKV